MSAFILSYVYTKYNRSVLGHLRHGQRLDKVGEICRGLIKGVNSNIGFTNFCLYFMEFW